MDALDPTGAVKAVTILSQVTQALQEAAMESKRNDREIQEIVTTIVDLAPIAKCVMMGGLHSADKGVNHSFVVAIHAVADRIQEATRLIYKWLLKNPVSKLASARDLSRDLQDVHRRIRQRFEDIHMLETHVMYSEETRTRKGLERECEEIKGAIQKLYDLQQENTKRSQEEIMRIARAAVSRETNGGQRLVGLGGRVISWSPDGRMLASGSEEYTAGIWDVASGERVKTLKVRGRMVSVAWSPDGRMLATSFNRKPWDKDFEDRFNPQIVGDSTSEYVHAPLTLVWDAGSDEQVKNLQYDHHVISLVLPFSNNGGRPLGVAWSPDGQMLASGFENSPPVEIWDAVSGKRMKTLKVEGHESYGRSLAWSPDSRMLATISNDHTVGIWEAASGVWLKTLGGHGASVFSVAWSPDGRMLASGSNDSTMAIWDAASGERVKILKEVGLSAVFSVAWSPDGRMLASGHCEKTVGIWDVASGKRVKKLNGHGDVYSVAWSPDGRMLATACVDGIARIWATTYIVPIASRR